MSTPKRSLWESYKALPKNTRILLGLAGLAVGLAGPSMMEYLNLQEPKEGGLRIVRKSRFEEDQKKAAAAGTSSESASSRS